jgi:hypothetical protein
MPTKVGIHGFLCSNKGVDSGPPPTMTVEALLPTGHCQGRSV